MTTQWIDDDFVSINEVGFLVRHHHNLKDWTRHFLRDRPCYTNDSHCPRLYGWCGTTNDLSVHAMGMARVIKIAKNGRAKVQFIPDTEIVPHLEELGYPELADAQLQP